VADAPKDAETANLSNKYPESWVNGHDQLSAGVGREMKIIVQRSF
jgi:hypothetical protein